jgi:hypothetical protein
VCVGRPGGARGLAARSSRPASVAGLERGVHVVAERQLRGGGDDACHADRGGDRVQRPYDLVDAGAGVQRRFDRGLVELDGVEPDPEFGLDEALVAERQPAQGLLVVRLSSSARELVIAPMA